MLSEPTDAKYLSVKTLKSGTIFSTGFIIDSGPSRAD